ncbi:uncharacterized [Tachysurus ichikawai]
MYIEWKLSASIQTEENFPEPAGGRSAGVRHTSADDCMMVMGVPLGLSRKAGALAFDLGPGSSSTQLLPVVVHG